MNLNDEIRHINRRLDKIEDELNHQKKNKADVFAAVNELEKNVLKTVNEVYQGHIGIMSKK